MPNVNNLEFVQLSATLAEMLHQATGQSVQSPINTGEFVSVGQTLLKVNARGHVQNVVVPVKDVVLEIAFGDAQIDVFGMTGHRR